MTLYLTWLLMFVSGFVLIEPSPFELLGLCLLGFAIVSGLNFPKGLGTIASIYGLYLVFSLPGSLLAPDSSATFKPLFIRTFLGLIMLYLASLIFANPKRNFSVLMNGYVLGCVIVCAMGILAYFQVMPSADTFLMHSRVKSTFKDPNVFGPYLVPVMVYLFYRLESNIGRWYINLLFFSIALVALLLSFSRGAWVNLILAMSFYIALRFFTMRSFKDVDRLIKFAIFGLVVAIILLGYLLSTDIVGDLFRERAKLQGYDVNERFHAQQKAIEYIYMTPLGIGLKQSELPIGIVPHNVYLYIFLEAGWLAGTFFITFILMTIYRAFKFCLLRTEMQFVGFVLLGCLISTFLQSFLIDSTHWRHIYILLGFMWGLILHYEVRLRA